MTPRDVAYLETVEQIAGEGWCQAPRGKRLDLSGLTWGQWRGAQAAAVQARFVQVEQGNRAEGEPDRVRLSPQGLNALHLHRSAQGQHRGPAQVSTPLVNEPTSSPERTLREKEPNKAVRPAQGGVQTRKPRALERMAAAFERIAAAAEVLAMAKVERCGCDRVKEPAKKWDGTTFMRCPAWKSCTFWREKAERPSEGAQGPVSSKRSEQERRVRLKAKAQALAERFADYERARCPTDKSISTP